MKHSKELHLRDFGYSVKFPKRFRVRAIKKACKVFSEETVVNHMMKIAKYHEAVKEDLNTISFYKNQKEIMRASDEIEVAYTLFKSLNERVESPFEKEVLSNNTYELKPLPLPLPSHESLLSMPSHSYLPLKPQKISSFLSSQTNLETLFEKSLTIPCESKVISNKKLLYSQDSDFYSV